MSAAATRPDSLERAGALGGAFAFGLVVLAETGRQPVDNPDTHLELTMVHEGPLLEYAGRDLAYLQWAAAARHWVVLVLACRAVPPPPGAVRGAARAARAVAAGAVRRAGGVRDGAGEDADPARAAAARASAARCACWGWRAGSPGAAR